MGHEVDYTKPPVVEVAIGIQFAPLLDFLVAHVGLYWSRIRGTFGHAQEHPPIVHLVEQPQSGPAEPPAMLEPADRLPMPRTWFLDDAGARLVQVQRDRFLYNWRKMAEEEKYPRYPAVKEAFLHHWAGFRAFLEEQRLQAPAPDQCELTYVNHIRQGQGWESVADIHRLFTSLQWRSRTGFLPTPETARWSLGFPLPDDIGRLHLDVRPVRLIPDNSWAMRFSLTARGKPKATFDEASMVEWFDLARRWVVEGFEDLTSEETDTLWGKR